jgi:hypothetical protein
MKNNIELLREIVFLIENSGTELTSELSTALSIAKTRFSKNYENSSANTGNCYRLAYTSTLINELDLSKISDHACKYNREMEITGAMIHKDKCLIQLLEGPKLKVIELAEKIKYDKRHKNFKVIISSDNHSRLFPDWGMASFNNNSHYFKLIFEGMQEINELKYALVDLENGIKSFVMPKRIVRYVNT